MKRRRLLRGGLGGLVGVGSAGCGAPGGSGSGRPGDPIVLTVLSHYGSEPLKSALQNAIDEWNAGHDRVQVRSTAVRYADLLTTAMVRQAAGQGADIIHPYTLWAGQLVRAGVLAPLPDEAAARVRRGFTDAAVTAASVDGRLYGYPTEVQTYALYCNTRLLREAGVERPPRTWRELEEAAYAGTRRDRHGNTLVQGFGLSRAEDSTVVGQTLALLAASGGSYLTEDGTRAAIGSPKGRAVIELERRLIDRGASSPGTDLYKAFPSGQVAMAISAGWWTGSLKNTMGRDYRDVTVVPVPGPGAEDRGTITTGFLLGVNAKSRHQEAAWDFLRWLNTDEVPARRPGGAGGAERRGAAARAESGRRAEAGTRAEPNTRTDTRAEAGARGEPGTWAEPGTRADTRAENGTPAGTRPNTRTDTRAEAGARGEAGARAGTRAEPPTVTRMSALQVSVGSMTGRSRDMRALLDTARDANLGPFLDALRYATPEPNGPHAQKAKTLLRKNIEEVWSGQQPVDKALRTACRQIDQELSRG